MNNPITRTSALLALIISSQLCLPETANASSLIFSAGTSTYGFTTGLPAPGNPDPIAVSNDAQSFIAIDQLLVSASMPLMAQTNYVNNVVYWEFKLWGDNSGQPGQVIANFGSFDPGDYGFEIYTAAPTSPISLVSGNRYYLGLSPIGDLTSPPTDAILALGQNTQSTFDSYPDGQAWAIRHNRYSLGDTLISPQNFDFNMTINFSPVPLPPAIWLFGSGLAGLVGVVINRKRNAYNNQMQPTSFVGG